MPADFGEIASYHREEAARFAALARAARDQGDLGKAEYLAGQAARHDEAAREQKAGMRQQPVRRIATQRPYRRPPEPQPILPAAVFPGILRGVKRIAATVRQSIFERNTPFRGLSLR
jgi:hypothetical protein